MNKYLPLGLCVALAACGSTEAPAPAPTAAPAAPEPAPAPAPAATGVAALLDGAWRAPENAARDGFRHPVETLAFFGVEKNMKVLEITPGGGWYAELLAPYLREEGKYVGALIDPASASSDNAKNYYSNSNEKLREKFAATPDVYDRGETVEFDLNQPVLGKPESYDVVLTFRNVHNWMNSGSAAAMFDGFYTALRPGGVLGVVEHRAAADVPEGDRSGYLGEAQVIALAERAGFVLEEKSEINANPADTKDHPNGVWTLPPSLRLPEGDDGEKYRAIGESDRMTLRFRKSSD